MLRYAGRGLDVFCDRYGDFFLLILGRRSAASIWPVEFTAPRTKHGEADLPRLPFGFG